MNSETIEINSLVFFLSNCLLEHMHPEYNFQFLTLLLSVCYQIIHIKRVWMDYDERRLFYTILLKVGDDMYQKRWFQTLIAAILLFLLILLIKKTEFFFHPIFTYIGAIAFPVIVSGVLYYISRPLVYLLEKYKTPKIVAILVVFILLLSIMYVTARFIFPIAQQQFSRFTQNLPAMIASVEDIFIYWQHNQGALPEQAQIALNDALNNFFANVKGFTVNLTSMMVEFIARLVQFLFLLVLVPFFLFYMLKDGGKLRPFVTKFFTEKKASSINRLLKSIDKTLSAFIQGQMTVSLFVGIMLFVGYLIIGLNYSLSLALFGLLTNMIPFVGPYLAVIPAILVAFFQDPVMIWYVIIIMIIAQQIEGNLISPNIMGKALSLHPLTIITLILAAGNIAGFLGLLFVIPVYAVIKTILSHFYHEWFNAKEI